MEAASATVRARFHAFMLQEWCFIPSAAPARCRAPPPAFRCHPPGAGVLGAVVVGTARLPPRRLLQALADRLRLVIIALVDLAPALIADAFLLRGHVVNVIDRPALAAGRASPERRRTTSPPGTTMSRTASERAGSSPPRTLSRASAWGQCEEAIEDEARVHVGAGEALLHHADDRLVGHQAP